ncbi:MAG: pyocin knob domain-containing protein, partial [Vibrio toranzoniae]
MSVKFSNNGKTTVSSAVSGSTTTISVNDASVFPSISASDYFYVTLDNGQGDLEICKVTNVNTGTNKLTVVRAQEGTTASAFDLGTKVENRLTAGGLNDVLEQSNQDTLQDVTARGNTLTTNIKFSQDEGGIDWVRNTDAASIKFYNDSDADTNSRLEFHIRDNKNEFFLFTSYDHTTQSDSELLKIHPTADMTFRGNKVYDAGDFTNNATNWDAAYSWGDHGTEGYITSFDITEQTDPKYLRSDADNTTDKKLELIGANHHPLRIRRTTDANAGIVFEKEDGEGSIKTRTYFGIGNANGELTVGDEADTLGVGNKIWHSGDFDNNATEWDAAYSWGDHGTEGYLTTHQDISGKLDKSGGTITGSLDVTGNLDANSISTNGFLLAGDNSGGVGLSHNDGYGNANVTFNHQSGTPYQDGNAARIEVNTDAADGDVFMSFEGKGGVTAGTAVGLNTMMQLGVGSVKVPFKIEHIGDADTFIAMETDKVYVKAGDVTKYNSNNWDDAKTLNTELQVKGGLITNVISPHQPPGTQYGPQQLVLNAGESYGKVVDSDGNSTQTGEHVYVNAENGLRVSTPDSEHPNWAAGYTVKATQITGESITVSGNEVWHAGNLTDHADAGYLTTHQDISGKLDRAGGTLKDSVDVEYSAGNTFNLLCNNTGFQTLNIASNELDAGVDKYIYIGKNTGNKAGNATFVELGDDSNGSLVKAYGDFKATGEISASGGNSGEWNTAYDWGNHADAGYITTHQNLPTSLPADGGNSDTVDNKHAADFFLRANGDVTGDFDNYTESGNYYVSNWNPADGTPIANGPTYTFDSGEVQNAYGWGMLRVSNFKSTNSFIVQEYIAHQSDGIWMRIFWSTHGWTAWRQQYTNASDGNSDGLNADTLDGQEGSYYTGYTDTATTNSGNWDTAYGWGDHSAQGYITSHQSLDSYALKSYVDDEIAGLVDSSPDALNTLNELAAALGDDPNFATTVTQSIGTKWTQDDDKIGEWNAAYSRVDNTRLGLNSHSLVNFTSAEDYAKPAGYSTHMRGTGQEQNVVGTPKTASYWYYNVHARRDTGTGTAATLMNYDGNDFYYGTTGVKTSAPVWRRVWDDNNFSATDVSNWNTAYGWGDHASAGYLTSETHANAGYLTSHQDISGKLDKTGGTMSGGLTIETNNPNLIIQNNSGDGAGIKFKDIGDDTQYGNIEYFHQDGKSYGSGECFVVRGDENEMSFVVKGKVMYEDGLWVPGTANNSTAAVRKDENWDTAYGWGNHASAGYLTAVPSKQSPATSKELGNVDLDDYAQHADAGFYHQTANSDADTEDNWPNGRAGSLLVQKGANSGNFGSTQLFIDYSQSNVYVRSMYGNESANRDWKRLYTTSDFTNNSSNWNTAYGWGDHADAGYAAGNHGHEGLKGTWQTIDLNSIDGSDYSFHWDHYSNSSSNTPGTSTPDNANGVITANTHSANYRHQIAFHSDEKLYHRAQAAGTWVDWQRILTTADDWDHSSAGYLTSHQDISGKLDKTGGTMTGQLTIQGTSPQMKFVDTGDHDDFWVHVNSNRFYILPDRNEDGGWETPYALELDSGTNKAYTFGSEIWHAGNFTDNSSNWDTAHGWGNHASAGYLTNHNPAVLASTGNAGDLNTQAYRAGMYGFAPTTVGKPADNYGQVLSIVSSGNTHNDSNNWITQLAFGTGKNTAYFRGKTNDGTWGDWKTFFHSGNFTDNSSNWDTAYGWGNHADAGYLTSETHASAGYLTSHQNISGKANLTGANFTGNIARVGTGNNDAPAADTTVMSGYGLIGNRVNPLYITNSAAGGSVQIGVGGAHNSNSKLSITADLASLTVPISTSGSITASGNVTAYSDERLKEDVETL